MTSLSRLARMLPAVIMPFAFVGFVSLSAQTAYQITSIDYPGVGFTEVFGINDNGLVVGISNTSFTFDSRTGVFTPVADDPDAPFSSVLGVNDLGVMAGAESRNQATENGFVRSKDGTFTAFSKPGADSTEPRGVSNRGLVTGFSFENGFSSTVGFIYNPVDNTFIEILPGPNTAAQGINASGEVVGSAVLPAGAACTGCPAGTYGWRRAPSGDLTFFQVNGQRTRARGISDSGVITGFVFDPVSGHTKGFVVRLAHSSYQSFSVPDGELLEMPGAVSTAPQAINNSGEIVGIWFDASFGFHGFIATPSPSGR